MGRSVILRLFAFTKNLFAFLMHLTLNYFVRLALCACMDLQLLPCSLACQTIVPSPVLLVGSHSNCASQTALGWSERFICWSGVVCVSLSSGRSREATSSRSCAAGAVWSTEVCRVCMGWGHWRGTWVQSDCLPAFPWPGALPWPAPRRAACQPPASVVWPDVHCTAC